MDSSGGLYLSDSSNHRVLHFPAGKTTADRVYGQFGSFSMNAVNNSGKGVSKLPGAENLAGPQGVAVSSDGRLYISDTNNNRVLLIEKPAP